MPGADVKGGVNRIAANKPMLNVRRIRNNTLGMEKDEFSV